MKMDEIRKIAKSMNLKTSGVKKADLIHAIQAAEGNPVCFATATSDQCGQPDCLWREDCN
ncbi:MAG: SAP domain-containing protein [Desulfuromonadaceae bacterium]|nr:SAP domain-containing protein [Desulfuromonadaceae bacterium]